MSVPTSPASFILPRRRLNVRFGTLMNVSRVALSPLVSGYLSPCSTNTTPSIGASTPAVAARRQRRYRGCAHVGVQVRHGLQRRDDVDLVVGDNGGVAVNVGCGRHVLAFLRLVDGKDPMCFKRRRSAGERASHRSDESIWSGRALGPHLSDDWPPLLLLS